jgi:hypothetical protein
MAQHVNAGDLFNERMFRAAQRNLDPKIVEDAKELSVEILDIITKFADEHGKISNTTAAHLILMPHVLKITEAVNESIEEDKKGKKHASKLC